MNNLLHKMRTSVQDGCEWCGRILGRCLSVGVAVLVSCTLGAQVTMSDLPYVCDFEDDAEIAQWVLNPGGAKTVNEWVVGECEAYGGKHSLYVSSDGGAHNRYANKENIVYAYRTMNLDPGRYDFAFDWKGVGNGKKGYLKVFLSSRASALIRCQDNASEPSWFRSNVVNCISETDPSAYLSDSPQWSHFTGSFEVYPSLANRNISLLLAWVNDDSQIDTTSIMIDNLRLAKASPTGYPSDIYVKCDNVQSDVMWTGAADGYVVRFRPREGGEWTEMTTDEPKLSLTHTPWGAYEFWISCINGADESVPTVFPLVYLYPTACFDVLNMYNAAFATGTWASGNVRVSGHDKVDDGYKSIDSRHTTHFYREEYDPRTNGKLRTVPDGEYGSVRLGNWRTGAGWESIAFKYAVTSDEATVLLLKYAIVLEDPGHSATQNPRFTMSITGKDGKVIDTECAQVDFHSPTASEWRNPEIQALWHKEKWVNEKGSATDVVWQDWRVMGIDLTDYRGEELMITFTTYDCSASGHFGYAYFMLNCTRSDVQGIPWGDNSSTQQFTAPDGFKYTWINRTDTAEWLQTKDESLILSEEQTFPVHETDTNTYICYVTYVNNANCGWQFEASAKPHNPVAEILCRWKPEDCKNRLWLQNRAHIGLTNQLTGVVEHRYDMHTDYSRWTMPDGTIITDPLYDGLYIDVPDTGGTYTFALWTAVEANDSVFTDSTLLTVQAPAIGPLEYRLPDDTICYGEQREFPIGSGNYHHVSGLYTENLVSLVTGCDSVILYNLTVLDSIGTTVYDTICADGTYVFGNRYLTEEGVYSRILPSALGCDSTIQLHLSKVPPLSLRVENTDGCAESITFVCSSPSFVDTVLLLLPDTVVVPFGRQNNVVVVPASKFPAGHHVASVRFLTPWCTAEGEVDFTVNLPASVVEAKWDNVLAILNEKYNGGYRFVSFQWYADGVLVPGATQSYYHAPEIDWEVEYEVEVVLQDGTLVRICPFTFAARKRSDAVAVQKKMENGRIYIYVNDNKYNVLGERMY